MGALRPNNEYVNEPTITEVTGTVAYSDGREVQFVLQPEGATRWGEVREVLGRAVAPTDAMQRVLADGDYFTPADQ